MLQYPAASAALIIPALNEEAVLGQLLNALPHNTFRQIIVADNGSSDQTAQIALSYGAAVVTEPRRGYGAACLKALAALDAHVHLIVFMQADLSENPDEIGLLLQPLMEGRADLVIGSRTLGKADPGSLLPHQRFGNWLASRLVWLLYRHRYTDLGSFRAITKEALDRLEMQDRDYGWTIEMQVRAIQCGLRVIEVPVSYRKRLAGENKVSGNARASILAGIKILSVIAKLAFRNGTRRSRS